MLAASDVGARIDLWTYIAPELKVSTSAPPAAAVPSTLQAAAYFAVVFLLLAGLLSWLLGPYRKG